MATTGTNHATDTRTSTRRRAPKGDKRARTRAKLLDAARALIREKGYERTTLQDVAARAGMTIGAIYGNFKNREDLFIALADAYWAPVKPLIKPDSTFAEKMRALAEATVEALPERRLAAVGRLTGMAYAIANDTMRARVRDVTAQSYERGAAWVRSVTRPEDLAMPPEIFVRVLHAVMEGLTFQKLLTPDLISDDVFYAAFEALSRPRGGDRPAGQRGRSNGPFISSAP
jgi:AcrR family transcriptional regulator